MTYETEWTFKTKNFTVAFEVAPEEMDPADSFQFQEDIEAVRNGDVAWFCARVSVYKNDKRIGVDHLGGCAYKTVSEFYTAHRDSDPMNRNCTLMRAGKGKISICHYFPDMVSQAISDARKTLGG